MSTDEGPDTRMTHDTGGEDWMRNDVGVVKMVRTPTPENVEPWDEDHASAVKQVEMLTKSIDAIAVRHAHKYRALEKDRLHFETHNIALRERTRELEAERTQLLGTISDLTMQLGIAQERAPTAEQVHYEAQRVEESVYRCPKCGGSDTGPGDYAGPEDHGIGLQCHKCGYNDQFESYGARPFIMPGTRGSHDQLSDYEPVPS